MTDDIIKESDIYSDDCFFLGLSPTNSALFTQNQVFDVRTPPLSLQCSPFLTNSFSSPGNSI